MKSLKNIMIALLMLSSTVFTAQIKNQKKETVKIHGNCATCESSIEKAGTIKNLSIVDWDKDTKMAKISFDSLKTSKEEILKRIALAGYDNDAFLAPDDTYANLPSCCQYERAKKIMAPMEESVMDMNTKDHSEHSGTTAEKQEISPLTGVYESYFGIKDALVKSDGASASEKAKNLLNAINEVRMDDLSMEANTVWMKTLEPLKNATKAIADTKDVEKQRSHLNALSKEVHSLINVSNFTQPVYYQYCPMKDANWLSKEETVKNPYFGSQMLSCGKTVETINKQ